MRRWYADHKGENSKNAVEDRGSDRVGQGRTAHGGVYTSHKALYNFQVQILGDSTNLALILLAAFWSGTSTVFTGIKETNSVRDRIITGKIGEKKLASKDRLHTFWWDWAPLKLSLACISAVLTVVILVLPVLRGGYWKDGSFSAVCLIASAMPAIGTFYQLLSFAVDVAYLKRIILDAGSEETSAQTSSM